MGKQTRNRFVSLARRLTSMRKGQSNGRKNSTWFKSISDTLKFDNLKIFSEFRRPTSTPSISPGQTGQPNIDPYSIPEPTSNCCGQIIPIRVLLLMIGILELLALLITCVAIGVAHSHFPSDHQLLYTYGTALASPQTALGISFGSLFIGIISVLLMIWGLHTERAVLLIPHMIGQMTAGIGLLVLISFLSIYTAVTHYEVREQTVSMTIINLTIIAFCAFALILTGWFFVYSLSCYQFIRIRERFRKEQTKGRKVKYYQGGGNAFCTVTTRDQIQAIVKSEPYGFVL